MSQHRSSIENPPTIRRERNPLGLLVAVLLLLFLLVSIGQSVYLVTYVADGRQQREILACQERLNTAFREALTGSIAGSALERAAQRRVFDALIADREVSDVEEADYRSAITAADAARGSSPLPQPSGSCEPAG